MKRVYPDFYKDFKCTAGQCRHSCCVGWEIDVDKKAMERFSRVEGELGRRLRENISECEEPHFVLTSGERCPFLNGENLCDIILSLGEDALCQICTDHPRFRTFLSDRTEIGLGLCCEEAGRLLLGHSKPIAFISEGDEAPDDEEAALLALREKVLTILQDESRSVADRIAAMLALAGAKPDIRPIEFWSEFFLGLERLDGAWTGLITDLRDNGQNLDFAGFDDYMSQRQQEYENLLVYFVYRHFLTALEDGDVVSKLRFAALGYGIIHALGAAKWQKTGVFTMEDQIELARLFSSEIEYSQENMDALFDELM